jgi:hypothetical protein
LGPGFFCHVNILWIGRNNPFFLLKFYDVSPQKKKGKKKKKKKHMSQVVLANRKERTRERERERKKSREIEREALGVVVKHKESKQDFFLHKRKRQKCQKEKAAADEVITKNFNICFYSILFYFILFYFILFYFWGAKQVCCCSFFLFPFFFKGILKIL